MCKKSELTPFFHRYRFFTEHLKSHCERFYPCPCCGYPTLIPKEQCYDCFFCDWEGWDSCGIDIHDTRDDFQPNYHGLNESRHNVEHSLCCYGKDYPLNDYVINEYWNFFSRPVLMAKTRLKQAYEKLMELDNAESIGAQWEIIQELTSNMLTLGSRIDTWDYQVKLHWLMDTQQIYCEPPSQYLFFKPRFELIPQSVSEQNRHLEELYSPPWPPFVHGEEVSNDTIVLDIEALAQSARQPGGYYLINCSCGHPDDADINEVICVSHPNPDEIVWHWDIKGYKRFLHPRLNNSVGYISFHFSRAQYEDAITEMLDAADAFLSEPIEVEAIFPFEGRGENEADLLQRLRNKMAEPTSVLFNGPKEVLLDAHYPFHLYVDGNPIRRRYTHYCADWHTLNGFRIWLDHMERHPHAKEKSEYSHAWVVTQENIEDFNIVGKRLAEYLQQFFSDETTVIYCNTIVWLLNHALRHDDSFF